MYKNLKALRAGAHMNLKYNNVSIELSGPISAPVFKNKFNNSFVVWSTIIPTSLLDQSETHTYDVIARVYHDATK